MLSLYPKQLPVNFLKNIRKSADVSKKHIQNLIIESEKETDRNFNEINSDRSNKPIVFCIP